MKLKRWLILFIAMLVMGACFASAEQEELKPGASVFFGKYEQDNKPENGEEAIEWTVLDIVDQKALLVSRYALDCQPYNDPKGDVEWVSSGIRKWLNEEFLPAAFTEKEQEAIISSSVSNSADQGNPDWDMPGEGDTVDKVFLLSYAEAVKYMQTSDQRKLQGTEYARSKGARFLGFTAIGIGETDWWTRSVGRVQSDGAYFDIYGNVNTKQVSDKQGVRPAIWLDLYADRTGFPYEQFLDASAKNENSQYEEAADIFETLGTYQGSEELAKQCRYNQARGLSDSGDFDAALKIYEKLNGYLDSYELGRNCRYSMAVAAQEAGDYKSAIKLFTEVGQYKESMARLKQCFDKEGISVYYFSEEAVNAGVDTGYSKSDKISVNDNHYGWRLGRFFVSDFTRAPENTSSNPVFLKTLGDSITLWFDLEQDIEALNGNKNLIIGEDQNGYDQNFGVNKTNFGRGTLIVRHTDYQNSKGDPAIYTDYILAKGTSGANTRVVLNEEGDYEVALDYMIQDNDVTHIFNKFGEYSIRFKFSIRNGNCMVFPFDVATKAELKNTAITENGFYLDLARSRYLDIDVKRTVLVDNGNGVVEDERFNRPAKDGDQYTQEGIYTISVSNRYTGESTTKTLFVGTQELLDQYVSMGFSADRLK